MPNYIQFLENKQNLKAGDGFKPIYTSPYAYDFQTYLTNWSIQEGRSAVFADCGLGKTLIQLTWAENVVRHTNKPVLLITPLQVTKQTEREAEKFDIEAKVSRDGTVHPNITITNYERLHYFNTRDFAGVVCDESSILKNFKGKTKDIVTKFMRKHKYRLLCTATAAPNDHIELGTSSEALGKLGYMDMLNKFFVNDQNNSATGRFCGKTLNWRFKGHAEDMFWRWVSSWARVMRSPEDYGFDGSAFELPELQENEHLINITTPRDGCMVYLPAVGLREQQEDNRNTIKERCGKAAGLVEGHDQSLIWCNRNAEGDHLKKIIPDAVQISGSDDDDKKEEAFLAFVNGEIKTLITKPKIGAWGLNFQQCAHTVIFPTHSYEQYYQSIRRFWRFGQKRPVIVDIVTTNGESGILKNLKQKGVKADLMFTTLIENMNNAIDVQSNYKPKNEMRIPKWM